MIGRPLKRYLGRAQIDQNTWVGRYLLYELYARNHEANPIRVVSSSAFDVRQASLLPSALQKLRVTGLRGFAFQLERFPRALLSCKVGVG